MKKKKKTIPALYADMVGGHVRVIIRQRESYTTRLLDVIDGAVGVVEEVKWLSRISQIPNDRYNSLNFLVRFDDGSAWHIPVVDCHKIDLRREA